MGERCKNCGYCPHCGQSKPPYNPIPYNPWPYRQWPPYTYPNIWTTVGTSVTASGASSSGGKYTMQAIN